MEGGVEETDEARVGKIRGSIQMEVSGSFQTKKQSQSAKPLLYNV